MFLKTRKNRVYLMRNVWNKEKGRSDAYSVGSFDFYLANSISDIKFNDIDKFKNQTPVVLEADEKKVVDEYFIEIKNDVDIRRKKSDINSLSSQILSVIEALDDDIGLSVMDRDKASELYDQMSLLAKKLRKVGYPRVKFEE